MSLENEIDWIKVEVKGIRNDLKTIYKLLQEMDKRQKLAALQDQIKQTKP